MRAIAIDIYRDLAPDTYKLQTYASLVYTSMHARMHARARRHVHIYVFFASASLQ